MKFDDALNLLGIQRGDTQQAVEDAFSQDSARLVRELDHTQDIDAMMRLQQQLMDLTAAVEIVRLTLEDDPKALDKPPSTVVVDAPKAPSDDPVDRLIEGQRQAREASAGTRFISELTPPDNGATRIRPTPAEQELEQDPDDQHTRRRKPVKRPQPKSPKPGNAGAEARNPERPAASETPGSPPAAESGSPRSPRRESKRGDQKDVAQKNAAATESASPGDDSSAVAEAKPEAARDEAVVPAASSGPNDSRPRRPKTESSTDQGWIDEPSASPRRRWALIGSASIAAAAIVAALLWPDSKTTVEQAGGTPPPPEVSQNALVNDFLAAQSALKESDLRLNKIEIEMATAVELLENRLAGLSARLNDADLDERAVLEAEIAAAQRLLERNRQRSELVDRFVLRGLDPLRAYATQTPTEIGGPLQRAVDEVQRAAGACAERLELFGQLERAIAARALVDDYRQRWVARGFAWPPRDEQVVDTLLDADTWDELPAIDDLMISAETSLAQGQFAGATRAWEHAGTTTATLLKEAARRTDRLEERILTLEVLAESALAERRLTSPERSNALAYYRQIMELDSDSPIARSGIERIQLEYLKLVRAALAENDVDKALRYSQRARDVAAGSEPARQIEAVIANYYDAQDSELARLVGLGRSAISTGELTDFTRILEEIRTTFPDSTDADSLIAERDQALVTAGYTFSEVEGLRLVVVPPGAFEMGFSGRRFLGMGGARAELPRHTVSFDQPFAIATAEVTVALFRRFIDATGHSPQAQINSGRALMAEGAEAVSNRDWSTAFDGQPAADDFPVIHVSQRDASAFAQWLGESTGARYRLPSESEFEYVQHGESMGQFPWSGDTPSVVAGNYLGRGDPLPAAWRAFADYRRRIALDNYDDGFLGPAPVATFSANLYGVHDMTGNVAEWTGDCYIDDYEGKDASGETRVRAGCNRFVIRGSAWGMDAETLRISYRREAQETFYSNLIGFRVVREL